MPSVFWVENLQVRVWRFMANSGGGTEVLLNHNDHPDKVCIPLKCLVVLARLSRRVQITIGGCRIICLLLRNVTVLKCFRF